MVEGPSDFTVSIHYDRRLYEHDIAGSMAHVRMLARQGIIDEEEMGQIVDGLMQIREEISAGEFPWKARARGSSHEYREPAGRKDRVGRR